MGVCVKIFQISAEMHNPEIHSFLLYVLPLFVIQRATWSKLKEYIPGN